MKIPRFMASKMLALIEAQGMNRTAFIRQCVSLAVRKNYRLKPSPQYLYQIFSDDIQPSPAYMKLFGEVLGVQVRDLFGEVNIKGQMRDQA